LQLGAKEAASIANLFDYGGIAGGILAGLVSDKTGGVGEKESREGGKVRVE
jgi:sugar phosphate permease